MLPATFPAKAVEGVVLADACRWYASRVTDLDDRADRTRIGCEVLDEGRIRDFFGFNRAKHAVLEAAILATRTAHLPAKEIQEALARLAIAVEKTAGPSEVKGFELIVSFIKATLVS